MRNNHHDFQRIDAILRNQAHLEVTVLGSVLAALSMFGGAVLLFLGM